MTLAETLLPKLNEWSPTGPGRHSWSLSLEDSGWSLSLSADRVDSLGCLFWEIVLTRNPDDSLDSTGLKVKAQAIADRVTGLLEPLHFIELDETRHEALLRSEAPSKRGSSLAYYEVLLSGGHKISVRRFSKDSAKTQRREQIAFPLTFESVAKFVEDLIRD